MNSWVVAGLLLLGALLGQLWSRMARKLAARGAWRPAAAFLAIAAVVGAAVMAVRGAWIEAAMLVAVALYLSVGARRRPARPGPRARAEPVRRELAIAEAARLLGVPPDASVEAVQAAYLRRMRVAHPDRGGPAAPAAQLNAARDILLRNARAGTWI